MTPWKSLGVSVLGIGHSDIRGLVTYRSMVRREPHRLIAWITDNCANIDWSWMARTLKWPKPFQDVFSCYFYYWPDVCGVSHLTSAWLSTIIAGWRCQGSEAPPAAAWPWYRQHGVIPVSGDMIRHHAPHETGKLTRNRCFSYIMFLTFSKNHFVVSAP